MRRPHLTPTTIAALWLLILLGAAVPLVRGGVDWPVQLSAAALACAALLLAASSAEPRVPVLVIGLAAATGVLAIQLVPVPPFLHRFLSPGAAALFEAVLRPIGLYPASRPLSLDPPTTGRELSKAIACFATAAAAAQLAGSRRCRDRLYAALALAGTGVAAAGLGAALAGAGPLLEPKLFFVNPNHLAGFLDLTAFIALGFGLRSYGRARLLWFMAFALAGTGAFLSLSRGGIVAFFLGAAAFTFLWLRRARDDETPRSIRRFAAVSIPVALVLALTAYVAIEPVAAELRTLRAVNQDVKLSLWPAGLDLIRRFPVIGIGRGAFATVFTAYQAGPSPVTFTHLENEWLQSLIDLGLPGGLLLMGAIAFTWFGAIRSRDLSRPEIGALAGATALVAHNVFDFSLEILGVALPFSIILGLLSRTQPAWKVRPVVLRSGALSAFGLAVLGMGLYRSHPTEAEAAQVARAEPVEDSVRLARQAARWHPADYLPPAAAGVRLVREGRCAEGLPWLGRAMALSPAAPEPHRLAARCLAAGGKDALAKREYRLAFLMGDTSALAEATRRYPSVNDLLEIAPDTPDGLFALGSLLGLRRQEDAAQVFQRAWEGFRDPRAIGPMAELELALGKPEQALADARTLQRWVPSDGKGYLIASAALTRLGRGDEAHQELVAGATRNPGSPAILQALVREALASRQYAEARRLADGISARDDGELATKRLILAGVLWAQGKTNEAIEEARAARVATPENPLPYLTLAQYCEAAGLFDDAIAAVRGAAALPGVPAGTYQGRLAELEARRQAQRDRLMHQQLLDNPESVHLP